MAARNQALGRHTTTLTVRGATVNESTGAITLAGGAAVSILAYADGFDSESTTDSENVTGYTTQKRNPVPLEYGQTVTVREIVRNQSGRSELETIHDSYDYIQVVETIASKTKTWTLFIERSGWARAKGKNVYELTGATFDTGEANPAVS